MSVVIIIGGSGRARAAIDTANQDGSNWTQTQKDAMAAKFNAFADDINHDINEYNKANA